MRGLKKDGFYVLIAILQNAGFQSEINSIMLDKQLLEHQQQDCMDKVQTVMFL